MRTTRCIKAIPRGLLTVGLITAAYMVLFAFGAMFGVGGDGCNYFADWLVSPFSISDNIAVLGVCIWPLLGLLLSLRGYLYCRMAAATVLVVQYVGIGVRSVTTPEWSYIESVSSDHPGLVVLFVLLYLAGHAVLWLLIARTPEKAEVPDTAVQTNSSPSRPLSPRVGDSENPYRSPES